MDPKMKMKVTIEIDGLVITTSANDIPSLMKGLENGFEEALRMLEEIKKGKMN